MALKFLNKKGWHTGSLRNLENVWKAEQKHEAEQKKLQELKVQIHKEREAEELRQLHVAAGIAPKQDRLEFLYDSGVGASSSKPSANSWDQNNEAKDPKKDSKPGQPREKFAPAIPGALFTESNTQSANDKWRKIHSDPLYLIKQQELAARERIRKNPVKMQMLQNQVRKTLEADKSQEKVSRYREDGSDEEHEKRSKSKSKSKDKHEKKRKHDRDGIAREKKRSREELDSGKRLKSYSPESRHRRKHDRHERY